MSGPVLDLWLQKKKKKEDKIKMEKKSVARLRKETQFLVSM